MALRSVNSLSHFTNWTIGHVHSGALGWVALTCFATLYYLIPRLWHTQLYSLRLAELHFWIATLGIVLYVTSMWVSGVTQGLMWRAVNPDGSLAYTFIETVAAIHVYDVIRVAGGALFLSGVFVMYANVWLTIRQGSAALPALPRGGAGRRRGRSLGMAYDWHRPLERRWVRFTLLDARRGARRRTRAAGPAVLPAGHDRAAARAASLRRARARGSRHLHPRGLQQLPQPAGAPAQDRDRALRPLLAGGRGHLRPTVPVGLAAHRTGSRARRRQVPRLVALDPLPAIRARSSRARTCRPSRSCRAARSTPR